MAMEAFLCPGPRLPGHSIAISSCRSQLLKLKLIQLSLPVTAVSQSLVLSYCSHGLHTAQVRGSSLHCATADTILNTSEPASSHRPTQKSLVSLWVAGLGSAPTGWHHPTRPLGCREMVLRPCHALSTMGVNVAASR